jgi:two-component system nitrogen regulation sensor histidine kinase GlnL
MAPDSLHTDILDNLKTAILLVDRDLSVSYLNPSAEALLEVSGSRITGEPISQLFTELSKSPTRLLDSINTMSAFTQRETSLRLPSGQLITVDCAVTPIVEDEQVSALVIELQPLDRLLRISREEAILASQQNSQALIRGLAHEIKNPLGGLRGAAQLLAKELPSETLTDYTHIIIEEADRLSNLLDRMLGSHDLLNLQVLNIHEVLERVRALVSAEAGDAIHILRDYDPSIPELKGDKERLIQAVLNIVRNAMQALLNNNPKPPPTPTITLKTRALRQFTIGSLRHRLVCRVEITDNGPGIPEQLLETIFLPMVSGRADGTGLGLSISQSIINHHHGLIECESQPGATTFSLYIPLDDLPTEQQA